MVFVVRILFILQILFWLLACATVLLYCIKKVFMLLSCFVSKKSHYMITINTYKENKKCDLIRVVVEDLRKKKTQMPQKIAEEKNCCQARFMTSRGVQLILDPKRILKQKKQRQKCFFYIFMMTSALLMLPSLLSLSTLSTVASVSDTYQCYLSLPLSQVCLLRQFSNIIKFSTTNISFVFG